MSVYASSQLYDFRASLVAAKARRRKLLLGREAQQVKSEDEYMRLFNTGGTYREVTYGYGYPTRTKPIGRVVGSTPSEEKVRRHEARFAEKPKPQRRTTPNLKAQVIELHQRGVIPAAIADTLNVSDRRVRSILAAA